MKTATSTFEDLLAELNKDPEFQKEYQRQKPYYDELVKLTSELKNVMAEYHRLFDRG